MVARVAEALPPLMMQNKSITTEAQMPEVRREKNFRRIRKIPMPISEICRPDTARICAIPFF